jgi:hypothetical protein
MSSINPAGSPTDPRIGPEQAQTPSSRRQLAGKDAGGGNEAASVTLSDHASVLAETRQLTTAENKAAAQGSFEDIDRAAEFVKQLAAQITASPGLAKDAQAHIHPRAALNLLA